MVVLEILGTGNISEDIKFIHYGSKENSVEN